MIASVKVATTGRADVGQGLGARYDHLVLDLVVAEPPPPGAVSAWAREALPRLGIGVLAEASHAFPSPVPGSHAYTLLFVLSASHLAVHSSPEHRWIQLAFALCRGADREGIVREAEAFFAPERAVVRALSTGADLP